MIFTLILLFIIFSYILYIISKYLQIYFIIIILFIFIILRNIKRLYNNNNIDGSIYVNDSNKNINVDDSSNNHITITNNTTNNHTNNHIITNNTIVDNICYSLLLIAHPDDELMFFSPLLFNITNIIIICLSHGNFYNEGNRRMEEIENVCNKLNIKLIILDYEDNGDWNENIIKNNIIKYLYKYNIKNIYTFDNNGVSKHKNHISCYNIVQLLIQQYNNDDDMSDKDINGRCINGTNNRITTNNRTTINNHITTTIIKDINIYCLISKNIFSKYIIDIKKYNYSITLSIMDYFKPYSLFKYHRSQDVWFRKIYFIFSNYIIYNDFIKIK